MNDKDDSGAVSVEEVMGILYLRYGRQLLDSVRSRARTEGETLSRRPFCHFPSARPVCSRLPPPPPPYSFLSQQLEDIFGTSDTNTGRELSLTEFLHSLNLSQVKQMRSKVRFQQRANPAAVSVRCVASLTRPGHAPRSAQGPASSLAAAKKK